MGNAKIAAPHFLCRVAVTGVPLHNSECSGMKSTDPFHCDWNLVTLS